MIKILIIEDEESVRENIRELLEAEDYETITAANGKIGIDLALRKNPDLILCDMMMPEIDGYAVLNRLSQKASTATIPFIFLTARTSKADFRRGMDLGADDYLTKPFTRTELLTAIISRLQKKALLKKHLSESPENSEIDLFASELQVVKANLQRTLEQGDLREFLVYYQPIVNIFSGEIIGAESLVRWQSPEFGMISPAEFIPFAESTGLIIPIGKWVLETVCNQIQIWDQAEFPLLRLSVNLSGYQLNQPDFSKQVIEYLIEADISPHQLELEINESIVTENVNSITNTMRELQNFGVSIAIDDFGTGYSSLLYLKSLPINTLKIDRYFIHNIMNDPQKSAITKGLINIAHNLDLNVIAKGVESVEELTYLREEKCDAMQGFLFSEPLNAKEFEQLIITNKVLVA